MNLFKKKTRLELRVGLLSASLLLMALACGGRLDSRACESMDQSCQGAGGRVVSSDDASTPGFPDATLDALSVDGALASDSSAAPSLDPGPYPIAECSGPDDVLVLAGDPGDPVHPGYEVMTQNPQTGGWLSMSLPGWPDVDFGPPNDTWRVAFRAANGSLPPGLYPEAGSPYTLDGGTGVGLYIGHVGPTACASTSGSFYINELTWSEAGVDDLRFIRASFEQHCGDAGEALRGCIYFAGE